MLLVHVWNHSPKLDAKVTGGIPALAHDIGRACVGVEVLGIKNAVNVLVSFRGEAGRAEPSQTPAPLLIVVDMLTDLSDRTLAARRELTETLGRMAKQHVGRTQPVEIIVRPFSPAPEGSWF